MGKEENEEKKMDKGGKGKVKKGKQNKGKRLKLSRGLFHFPLLKTS